MRKTLKTRSLALSFTALAAAFASACGTPLSPTAPEVEAAAVAVADEAGKASKSGGLANFVICKWCPLAIDPYRVPPNKLLTASSYLFNTGDAPAGMVGIEVSLVAESGRRTTVLEGEMASPRPGDRAGLPIRFVVPADIPEGRYRLEIAADPENRIRESDETDNVHVSSESLFVVR